MYSLPNFLSFSRIPLAFCLFIEDPLVRLIALFLAMISDVLDGFLARRMKSTSKLGTLLDPFTDKFFVGIALAIFLYEGKLSYLELIAFLSRDLSLLAFTSFLFAVGGWKQYKITAFYCGKIVTSLQFITLMELCLGWSVPAAQYVIIGTFGALSLVELLSRYYLHFSLKGAE